MKIKIVTILLSTFILLGCESTGEVKKPTWRERPDVGTSKPPFNLVWGMSKSEVSKMLGPIKCVDKPYPACLLNKNNPKFKLKSDYPSSVELRFSQQDRLTNVHIKYATMNENDIKTISKQFADKFRAEYGEPKSLTGDLSYDENNMRGYSVNITYFFGDGSSSKIDASTKNCYYTPAQDKTQIVISTPKGNRTIDKVTTYEGQGKTDCYDKAFALHYAAPDSFKTIEPASPANLDQF